MSGAPGNVRRLDKGRVDWETPPWLFEQLHQEFHFDVDAAASPCNALLPRFWTARDDGLKQSWKDLRVFCNPPYGRETTAAWVEKSAYEAKRGCPVSVQVLPANTETKWFHDLGLRYATEIRLIRLRISFNLGGRRPHNSRPVFNSCVMVFESRQHLIKKTLRRVIEIAAGRQTALVSSLPAPDPRLLSHGRLVKQKQRALPFESRAEISEYVTRALRLEKTPKLTCEECSHPYERHGDSGCTAQGCQCEVGS